MLSCYLWWLKLSQFLIRQEMVCHWLVWYVYPVVLITLISQIYEIIFPCWLLLLMNLLAYIMSSFFVELKLYRHGIFLKKQKNVFMFHNIPCYWKLEKSCIFVELNSSTLNCFKEKQICVSCLYNIPCYWMLRFILNTLWPAGAISMG